MKAKRLLTAFLASAMFTVSLCSTASAAYVKMYAPDGRVADVSEENVNAWKAVGWYDSPMMTVYSLDGRTLAIPSSQADEYANVGWYVEPVMMVYALDGRSLIIPQKHLEAYQNVGWYTWNGYYAKAIIEPSYLELVNAGDYHSLYFLTHNAIKSGATEQIYYTYRTKAMDMWREATGCPIGITRPLDKMIVFYNNGEMRIAFDYTNVGYKPIVAFKIKYDVCDIFGDVIYTRDTAIGRSRDEDYRYYCDPGDTKYGWGNTVSEKFADDNNLDDAFYIKNFRITEVVFDDETKWINPAETGPDGVKKEVATSSEYVDYKLEPKLETFWVF